MSSSRQPLIDQLRVPGIIAVVRAHRRDQVLPLSEALLAGGVRAIEITMTTPEALPAIRDLRHRLGPSAIVGVGTVLDADTARRAIDHDAQFVVTPILRPEIAQIAQAADRPVMLGAYTPTEAQLAHEAGADFVKLFPADGLGPAYVKALRAPLPHLRLVPTGGVDLTNAAELLRAGCAALGVGSSLVSSDILQRNDWPALTARARAFVDAIRDVPR